MKSDLFVSVAFLLVLFFSVGLASCRQETFDLDKKELDPRMVGTWRLGDLLRRVEMFPSGCRRRLSSRTAAIALV